MIKCRECNSDMYIEDVDRIKNGSRDEYWECPCCRTSCLREIRLGVVISENWHSENNGVVTNEFIQMF